MKDRKTNRRTKSRKMAVMTAECDRMFCVDKEQIQLFKKIEANQKNREKAEVVVSKISKKIMSEGDPASDDNS